MILTLVWIETVDHMPSMDLSPRGVRLVFLWSTENVASDQIERQPSTAAIATYGVGIYRPHYPDKKLSNVFLFPPRLVGFGARLVPISTIWGAPITKDLLRSSPKSPDLPGSLAFRFILWFHVLNMRFFGIRNPHESRRDTPTQC